MIVIDVVAAASVAVAVAAVAVVLGVATPGGFSYSRFVLAILNRYSYTPRFETATIRNRDSYTPGFVYIAIFARTLRYLFPYSPRCLRGALVVRPIGMPALLK